MDLMKIKLMQKKVFKRDPQFPSLRQTKTSLLLLSTGFETNTMLPIILAWDYGHSECSSNAKIAAYRQL
jgi:hypothetical protein